MALLSAVLALRSMARLGNCSIAEAGTLGAFVLHLVFFTLLGTSDGQSTCLAALALSGARLARVSLAFAGKAESAQLAAHFVTLMFVATFLGLILGLLFFAILFTEARSRVVNVALAVAAVLVVVLLGSLYQQGHVLLPTLLLVLSLTEIIRVLQPHMMPQYMEAVLDLITSMVSDLPGVVGVAACAAVAQVLYLVLWVLTFGSVLRAPLSEAATLWQLAYLFLSLRWTLGTVHGVVHGVSGAAMRHWLQDKANAAAVSEAAAEAHGQVTSTSHVPAADDAEFGLGSPQSPPPSAAASPPGATGHMPEGTEDSPVPPAEPQVLASEVDADVPWESMGAAHVGSAGTAMAGGASHMPLSAEAEASRTEGVQLPFQLAARAATLSLASLSLGSLLGLVSPVMWPLLRCGRLMGHRCGWAAGRRLGNGAAAGAEAVLMRSHKYTLVNVVWGQESWASAARQLWREFVMRGSEAVVTHDYTDRFMLHVCVLGGAMVTCLTGVGFIYGPTFISLLLAVFWLGFAGVALFMGVVEGADAGLVVAFTQAPEVISTAHWTLYHRYVRLAETQVLRRGPVPGSEAAPQAVGADRQVAP